MGLRVGLAGHPAILHYSVRTGDVRQIPSPNLPLAILPAESFGSSEIRAEHGDIFVLYTDGLLEVANATGEEFGLDRLQTALQKHSKEPLDRICQSLQESVAQHGEQSDDQSLLLIQRL